MKTKVIISRLEKLLGNNRKKKLKDKQLRSIEGLIEKLESKKSNVSDKLEELKAESKIPRYTRKLNLAELHLAKARAYKQKLEA